MTWEKIFVASAFIDTAVKYNNINIVKEYSDSLLLILSCGR
jgi:hypothetical protein